MVDLAVTDATACAGGLVLSLMLRFRVLNAVEVDADRVEDLRHNVQLVLDAGGAAGAGVTTHFSDYNAVACTLRQDILVIDPPWGGAAYSALPLPGLGQGGVPMRAGHEACGGPPRPQDLAAPQRPQN